MESSFLLCDFCLFFCCDLCLCACVHVSLLEVCRSLVCDGKCFMNKVENLCHERFLVIIFVNSLVVVSFLDLANQFCVSISLTEAQ